MFKTYIAQVKLKANICDCFLYLPIVWLYLFLTSSRDRADMCKGPLFVTTAVGVAADFAIIWFLLVFALKKIKTVLDLEIVDLKPFKVC